MKLKSLVLGLVALAGIAGCGSSDEIIVGEAPIAPVARFSTYLLAANLSGFDVLNVAYPSGTLTRVPGSPFASNPTHALTVHPSGRFFYAGVNEASVLEGFSLDPATGALTRLPGFPLATVDDNNPALSNNGQFLYVTGDTSMDGFRVDQATGAVTRLPGFPFDVPGMIEGQSQEFSPDGRFLFVADRDSNSVFTFAHDTATGALTPAGSQVTGGEGPLGVWISPDGRYLYAFEESGTLPGFSIDPDGDLDPLPGPVTVYAGEPSFTYQAAYRDGVLFVGDGASTSINAFRIGAEGQLLQVAGYPRGNGGGASMTAFPAPMADFIYGSDRNNSQITGFVINADKSLTPLPGLPFAVGGAPGEVVGVTVNY